MMIKFLIDLHNYLKKTLEVEEDELNLFYIWGLISFLTISIFFYKINLIYNSGYSNQVECYKLNK